MKTVTYICDKCGKSVGETELVSLSFSAQFIKHPNGYNSSQSAKKDVCKNCLREKGLITEYTKETHDADIQKTEKTMETKLIEFLEDLGVSFQE